MNKLLLTLALAAIAFTGAQAQGTIQFVNNAGTRLMVCDSRTPPNIFIGVFAGSTADSVSDEPAGPLGSNFNNQGSIAAPNGSAYQITGFGPGETVFLQFRGWSTAFGSDWRAARAAGGYYGEIAIRSFVLGPEIGPGTVVWSANGGDQFPSLILCVPEPSTVVLVGFGFGSLLLVRRRKS